MKSKKMFALILSLVMAMSLAACGSSSDSGSQAETKAETEAAESAAAEETGAADVTIRIGAVLPLTGAYASTGENLQAAMQVAEYIINNEVSIDGVEWEIAENAGINGSPVEVIFGDCQSDASVATTEADSLLDSGVAVITGAYSSGYSASVATEATEYGIPMVCGSSSSASLTDGETYSFSAYFNRVAANDQQESDEFFAYLKFLNENYDAGIEKVAIAYIDNSYGQHAQQEFEHYAEEYGFEIAAQVSYDSNATSADTEALEIKNSGADAVFQASYIADLTMFAQAYESIEYAPTLLICYCGGFQDASFASVAAELALNSNSFAGGQACTAVLSDVLPAYAAVNELYKEKTGLDMDGPALEEFASVIVAAQAIAAVGDASDSEAVASALKSETFEAPYLITGEISFDENGQNEIMASVITQLIDGNYEVVYPDNGYITSEPVLGGE